MGHYTDNDSDDAVRGTEQRENVIRSFPEVINTSKRNTSKGNNDWERRVL